MSDYDEFMSRSPEDIVLAIFDKLGVRLPLYQINYVGY